MLPLRKLFNIGVLDSAEPVTVKKVGRLFDLLMVFVMFWLPLQWYMEYLGELSPAKINVLNWIIWSIFVLETGTMTILVNKKLDYLISSWLNIFIIIAAVPPLWSTQSTYFALLRYLRFIILFRLILPQVFITHRLLSRNHFGMTLLIFLLVTLLSGVLVTYIDPEIGSLFQGIWWAWQTVTTVGYGDIIPNTVGGKAFAMLLMITGVSLYSLVAANLAAYFIERGHRQKVKKPERKVQMQLRELSDRLIRLEEMQNNTLKKLDQLLPKEPAEPPTDS